MHTTPTPTSRSRTRTRTRRCSSNSAPHPHLRHSPSSLTRISRPSGRTTASVWRPSYASPSCTSYTSLSTHPTHAVAFPVSPHRSSSAPTPTPTPAPTYISTLSPPTPPGVPPMVRSVSSPRAPVRMSLAPGGNPRLAASSRGKRRSPVKGLFPFFLSSSHSASAASTPCP
ncbi:hypothetical protein B0H14DRAFT_30250 [Mycena olivaceomarginata]|nr:hypothetical protein B0H14DRAFT_30250 [Mycena olivaceomarginata]